MAGVEVRQRPEVQEPVVEVDRRGCPSLGPPAGKEIGTRYAFSEMNDRWFGWKNLMSSDRRYV